MRYMKSVIWACLMVINVVNAREPLERPEKALPILQSSQEKPKEIKDMTKSLVILKDALALVRFYGIGEIEYETLVRHALMGMLSSVDPHSDYVDPEEFQSMCEGLDGSFGGLGIEVVRDERLIKVVAAIDDTPAAKAGMQPGDIIVYVNDTPVSSISFHQAVKMMRGKAGTKVSLTISRKSVNEPVRITLVREMICVQSVKWFVDNGIGCIRIALFDKNTTDLLGKALKAIQQKLGKNLKGYVLDMRNNPGGIMDQAVSVVNLFVDDGIVLSIRGRDGKRSGEMRTTPGKAIAGHYPVAVLVNGGSASASEIVAGALQDHKKALIIGTTTFGKGSAQTVIPLNDEKIGGAIKLTTARFYTPNGHAVQVEGIKPDIQVEARQIVIDNQESPFPQIREASMKGALAPVPLKKESEKDAQPAISQSQKDKQKAVSQAQESKKPVDVTCPSPVSVFAKKDDDYQMQVAFAVIQAMALQKHRDQNQASSLPTKLKTVVSPPATKHSPENQPAVSKPVNNPGHKMDKR